MDFLVCRVCTLQWKFLKGNLKQETAIKCLFIKKQYQYCGILPEIGVVLKFSLPDTLDSLPPWCPSLDLHSTNQCVVLKKSTCRDLFYYNLDPWPFQVKWRSHNVCGEKDYKDIAQQRGFAPVSSNERAQRTKRGNCNLHKSLWFLIC